MSPRKRLRDISAGRQRPCRRGCTADCLRWETPTSAPHLPAAEEATASGSRNSPLRASGAAPRSRTRPGSRPAAGRIRRADPPPRRRPRSGSSSVLARPDLRRRSEAVRRPGGARGRTTTSKSPSAGGRSAGSARISSPAISTGGGSAEHGAASPPTGGRGRPASPCSTKPAFPATALPSAWPAPGVLGDAENADGAGAERADHREQDRPTGVVPAGRLSARCRGRQQGAEVPRCNQPNFIPKYGSGSPV